MLSDNLDYNHNVEKDSSKKSIPREQPKEKNKRKLQTHDSLSLSLSGIQSSILNVLGVSGHEGPEKM